MEAEAVEGDRLIILVSDGVSADLGSGEEVDVGDELTAAGITVYHIHVAETDPPEEVRELANITGGDSFHAADAQSLEAVFAHIDRMEPARFASVGAVPMDNFRPFAIAALALLGVHTLGLMAMRYTPW
jgi:Ca-activated chloride channel family protein